MKTRHYDAVVIGSGPGGEGAAMTLAKAGREVAMVERHTMVGGGCTHWGTIPSKALRQTIQRITDFREDPLFQQIAEATDITYPQLLANAEAVITSQVRMRRRFYEGGWPERRPQATQCRSFHCGHRVAPLSTR